MLADQVGNCKGADAACASISIKYPDFTQAPSEAARAALNQFIKETLLAPTFTDQPADSLEARVKQFVAAYDEFRSAFPDAPAMWKVEQSVTIPYQDDRVITFAVVEGSYTGGAHPNEQTTYASFDYLTGERLSFDSLFEGDYEGALRAAGERAFRTARKLGTTESLADAGFQFENGQFALTHNFGIVQNGLRFYYNAYDVAPYVLGPTDMTVGWDELASMARAGGALERIRPH
ncbi:MAG: DUF3298 and DUF4163 domain-containing protein [Vicinamibacterales bacterium]